MEPSFGWTLSVLDLLPDDGKRYEIVGGELYVSKSPRHEHQRACTYIWKMLIALLVVFPITGQSQTLAVDGLSLPFQIIKAVNGVPVQEWKIEKYKINPDLKAKKFEKK